MPAEKRTEEELLARLTEAKAEIVAIDAQYAGQYIEPESEEGRKYNGLNTEVDDLEKTIKQVVARKQRVAELSGDPASTDEGASFLTRPPGAITGKDIYDLSTIRGSAASPQGMRAELHERAERAIDVARFPHQDADRAECQEALLRTLERVDDESGSFARRLLVTGDPSYKEGFGKWIASGGRMTTPQFEAAAMSVGTDSGGGFAVPFELDPTILPTSSGVVNPYRQMGRVVQTTAKEWDGVS
jgi:HK97 family phage major capsid protein